MQNNLFMRKIKRPYQKNLFLYCMKKYFKIGLWTVLTLWSVLLPVNYMPMWLNAEAISVKRTFTFSNNKRVFAKPDIPNSLYHMVHPCVYIWFIPGRSRETWNNPSILNFQAQSIVCDLIWIKFDTHCQVEVNVKFLFQIWLLPTDIRPWENMEHDRDITRIGLLPGG